MFLAEVAVAVVAAAGGATVFAAWLDRKIEKRRVLNSLLALGSEQFFTATDKIMKTPDDVPDPVLDLLMFMARSAFGDGSEKAFLRALRRSRAEPPNPSDELFASVAVMRKELQVLLGDAVAAWFNIMTHKSSKYHDLIALEALRTRVSTPRSKSDAEVALPVAHAMETAGCPS